MHDAISSEKIGTPALGVMTSKFFSAAELMARVLGMADYEFAIIDHPVSSASAKELEQQAKKTLDVIQKLIIVNAG